MICWIQKKFLLDKLFLKILLLDILLMGEQDNMWPSIWAYSAQNNNQIWQLCLNILNHHFIYLRRTKLSCLKYNVTIGKNRWVKHNLELPVWLFVFSISLIVCFRILIFLWTWVLQVLLLRNEILPAHHIICKAL